MKNTYLKFYTLLLYLFFSFSIHASDKIELTFFDVGQGNCTFVKCSNAPSLLVDIGSSAHRGTSNQEKSIFKNATISKIRKKITDSLISPMNKKDWEDMPDLNVVISHGDKDHYNWLEELKLNEIKHANKNLIKIDFLLGGTSKDYSICSNYLEKISQSNFIKIRYIDDFDDFNSIPKNLACGNKLKVDILSAIKSKNPNNKCDKEKNQNSIVLKLTYGQISCILTGDATGETTDKIFFESRKELKKLKVNILQASHHGADTEGSNQISFLQFSSPEFIVFSSGTYERYYHPAIRVCERAVSLPASQLREVELHKFQASGENEFAKNELVKDIDIDNFYTEYFTRSAFYNTTNQGDITFSWKEEDTILEEPKCIKNLDKFICKALINVRLEDINRNLTKIVSLVFNDVSSIQEKESITKSIQIIPINNLRNRLDKGIKCFNKQDGWERATLLTLPLEEYEPSRVKKYYQKIHRLFKNETIETKENFLSEITNENFQERINYLCQNYKKKIKQEENDET